MLKYIFFMIFFTILLYGYASLYIPPDSPLDYTLEQVKRGYILVFVGGTGAIFCLARF